ncbi:M48 family metallopeptidase [Nitrospinae bacterium]|nr:M48 family metallopeptidase [Nitrospinota bacterium]
MECAADCFDGEKSGKKSARLKFDQKGVITLVTDQGEINYEICEVVVSSRLGKTPRRLEMPDGIICEVSDNDIIDRFFSLSSYEVPDRLINKLESKLRYVIISVVITVLIVFGAINYGIPVLAKHVAFMVPMKGSSEFGTDALASLDEVIFSSEFGEDVLDLLDEFLFTESKLADTEKEAFRKLFSKVVEKTDPEYRFTLVFLKGNSNGANAMALPNGIIIFTDELIQLIEDDHEFESILAHEVGHVVYRHTLRQLIQDKTVALVIMAVTGDLSMISGLVNSLPNNLTEKYYSREFELEADRYAYEYLTNNNISTIHFANIMRRISGSDSESSFLATHPSTDERLRIFSE